MGERIKKIALAMVLTTLVAAVGASMAAAKEEVHIEGTAPFTLKAEQSPTVTWTLEGGLTIKCKKMTSEGTAASNVLKTIELEPTYNECTAFGFEATVDASECADGYTVTLLVLQQYEAAILYDILCLASKAVKVSTATCEVEIGSQTERKEGGANTLKTSPKTLEFDTKETGLEYNKTKDGFLCPLSSTGVKTDGKLEGKLNVKAFEGSTQKGIYIE